MNMPDFSAATSGIYRVPADVARLRRAVRRAGASWIAVDLHAAQGRRALLESFARVFMFPDTFGANWDALADCLQDLSWLPEQGWVVMLDGTADFAAAVPADHATLMDILAATASYWRQQGRLFIVLVDDGAGWPAFPAS